MKMNRLRFLAVLTLSGLLAACGGSGTSGSDQSAVNPPGGSSGGAKQVTSKGVITAFGSVYVNGVKYDTASSSVVMDDAAATPANLKVGMMVTVKGTVNADNVTGTSSSIEYEDHLEGPLASPTATGFTVLGQNVAVTATTVFDGAVNLAAVAPGAIVEVSGIPSPDGSLTATRVEVKNSAEYKLRGTVSGLTSGAFTLQVTPSLSYSVSYTAGMVLPRSADLVNGAYVKVKATAPPSGGAISATAVSVKRAGLEDSEQGELEGSVADLNSSQKTFSVNGTRVNAAGVTLPSGLANGVRVEVKGAVSGGVLTASSLNSKRESDKELKGVVSAKTDTTVTVNGQAVAVTPTTIYRDGSSKADRTIGFSAIAINDLVEIKGYQDGSAFTATRIERETASGDSTSAGTTQMVSKGVITAFGSVYVNGIRYDTTNAQVTIDDAAAGASGLAVGMVVRIKGAVQAGGATGTCSSIEYEDSLQGLATAVDAAGFTVLGQRVAVDAKTVFEGAANLAGMPANPFVEVSGFPNPDGSLTATRVEVKNFSEYKIRGTVSNLTATGFDLTVGPSLVYTVGYSPSAVKPAVAALVNGAYVKVKAASAPVGTVITASRVSVKQKGLDDSAAAEVEGIVGGYDATAKTFTINGVAVNAAGITLPAGFANGIRSEIKGAMVNGVLIASGMSQEKESDREIKGLVTAKDATSLTVGTTVIGVTPSTIYKDDSSLKDRMLTLAGISVNNRVEVKGYTDAGGAFVATKIERK